MLLKKIKYSRLVWMIIQSSGKGKLFGTDFECSTADKSTPEFDILKIKDSLRVKNLISDLVEQQREEKRITAREFMTDDDHEDGFEGHEHEI